MSVDQKKAILQRMYVDPFFFAQFLFGDKENVRSHEKDVSRSILFC